MAIYHCTIKNGGRSKGQSAVAASAYRSGSKMKDDEIGALCDYSRKGGVVYSEVSLCASAPEEYGNREILWNEVHKVEKAKDARLWREVEVALPREFDTDMQREAVREYVQGFTSIGMCADWSIHDKGDGNPHAHIMLTTRPIKADGKWGVKERKDYAYDENGDKIPIIDKDTGLQKVDKRNCKQWKRVYVQVNDWNNTERVEEWREAWAVVCNKRLREAQNIDHRSYERQGVEQTPTIHEGFVARKIEKQGEVSERCEINREIKECNNVLVKLLELMRNLVMQILGLRRRMEEKQRERARIVEQAQEQLRLARESAGAVGIVSDNTGAISNNTDVLIERVEATIRNSQLAIQADDSERANRIALEESVEREQNRVREQEAKEREQERPRPRSRGR